LTHPSGARPLGTFRFVVSREDAGKRLDVVLAARVPGLSRRKARLLLEIGGVFVDGARTKVAGRLARADQRVVVHLGGALERAKHGGGEDEELPRIVHEDADLLVVDKRSGVLTAPTPESDQKNLAHALGKRFGPIFVVHRIDLETSGLLVFARTDLANRALSALFREHDVDRAYLAALRGDVRGDAHVVELPIAGRRAVTRIDVTERLAAPGVTLVRCTLLTGRTHQIRIHARHLGHPVLGDPRYGERGEGDPPRMALHAALLGFVHPKTGEKLSFELPWPADLDAWLRGLGVTPSSAAAST
jgi:23S rRNA pseudouridine1911/1915/1917 synthase